MPTFDTLIAFFGIALLLGLAPGPDNVFVLLQSAMRGPRAGLTVIQFTNTHAVYALTWYGLALMVLGAAWLVVRHERRKRTP